ncbi:indolepyruvate ferredoxin oxidoreductase family protein [Aquabacterium sp. J223]|uniref:indolepyruvate ferredoxin oxidoreductase family protein n=1 Tax=Aquabacterium sp. J223 TaxID=2898431 RepID=UPI0021ADBB77|nr:indolepyruvate ferredoxin oxidoreductase family protein [Aquabacterium sp. J223]UUX97555.1 indolepyruvate ferredoxin oxidoreductase family protein [Aquabacterium sp. J223]
MNAALPTAAARAPQDVTLDDKYAAPSGLAFMSGVQALVKLPLLQQQRDALAGRRTAGFVSGYRGSPLGGYDQELWRAKAHLARHDVVFQPGVNEDLAATAVWGTQQLGFAPPDRRRFDGVFGLWYGKGPGVDRSVDVLKHANMAGTTPWGGVVAVAGDDHIAKSSTVAHQSDPVLQACGIPVFFPAGPQDILDLGLHAYALSRYAGVWSGLKVIQEVVESSASLDVDPARVALHLPQDFVLPAAGVHIRWPDAPLEQEARLYEVKLPAVAAYLRANRLNRDVIASPQDRFGLIASGKAYNETRQALVALGLDAAECRRLGIRLHKVAVVWPLEPDSAAAFARGLQQVLVVEEKRPLIEQQLKDLLFHWPTAVRPQVAGKADEHGEPGAPLLRQHADLSTPLIAAAIMQRLARLGLDADTTARLQERLARLQARDAALRVLPPQAQRTPWFCSGCPHNTSTVVPEGSRTMGGIGCHLMAMGMERNLVGFTQMGGEGVPWVGQQPFTTEPHVFANLGDGTYFHSGLIAIRQAIAAGVNITYKILYNDAVAMTGGQPIGERPEGHTPLQILRSLQAEGVRRLVVVTDEPARYDGVAVPDGVTVHPRTELDRLQREFRELPGVTAIVYDQTCATEKRRRRKRGTLPDPALRVMINDLVCEGCGDCGVQSNCLSVEPLETEFGRKRTINQSSCNKDTRCLDGFCPSFVTVEGGRLKKKAGAAPAPAADLLPEPPEPAPTPLAGPYGILVAGVGGTGVVTIGQVLGMAAHLEGRGVVTQDATGLAQKGGATWSHVLLAPRQDDILTTRIDVAGADLLLGCDPVVAASRETLLRLDPQRTRVALNAHAVPTAAFVRNADWTDPSQACLQAVTGQLADGAVAAVDAEAAAVRLLGDSLYANAFLLGFGWQRGWVPLARASLRRAIELNGVAVAANLAAFEWGRRAAHAPQAFRDAITPAQVVTLQPRESLSALVARREQFLTAYQDARYAARYRAVVERVAAAERPLGRSELARAVAHGLFKLMAYKDEYEVARLHADSGFRERVAEQFEGDFRIAYHLAPPLLSRRNARGELRKRRFGPATIVVLRLLARLRRLRGTALDPFGHTAERREERALIDEYRDDIESLLPHLTADNHALAVDLARVPEQIRGYGHVKARHLAAARQRWAALRQAWHGGAARRAA